MPDDRIHRRACFHHDHGFARPLERPDEFLHRFRRLDISSLRAAGCESLGHFGRAVKNSNRKSFRFHVENEVLAHHRQADEANIALIRGHFGSPFRAARGRATRSLASNQNTWQTPFVKFY